MFTLDKLEGPEYGKVLPTCLLVLLARKGRGVLVRGQPEQIKLLECSRLLFSLRAD
jgi:hypothetical protein